MRAAAKTSPDAKAKPSKEAQQAAIAILHRHNEIIEKYRNGQNRMTIGSVYFNRRKESFYAFAEWCFARGFDPADYYEALYVFSAPRMPKALQLIHVKPEYEKLISYKRLRDGPSGIVANREKSLCAITPAQEAVRRNAVLGPAGPSVCFVQTDPHGLYDPRSPWCAQCTLAFQCAVKINIAFGRDVVSLRRSSRM